MILQIGCHRLVAGRHLTERRAQPADQIVDLSIGLGIRLGNRAVVGQIEMAHHLDRPLQIVEDEQALDDHVPPGRKSSPRSGGLGHARLERAHRLVGKKSDGAAQEIEAAARLSIRAESYQESTELRKVRGSE